MSPTLLLLLIVAVVYLAAHLAFDWLARRFLIVSGAEFLVLGILLGPQVSGSLSPAVLESFSPLVTLSIAWFGVAVGMRLYVRDLIQVPGLHYRLAFGEALITLAFVAALEWLALRWLFDVSDRRLLIPALALGSIAVASTLFSASVVARHFRRDAPILRLLDTTAFVDAVVAILGVGLLLCIERPALAGRTRSFTATEWAVITMAIGMVGGALFHLFLGNEQKRDRLFVALAGSLMLASGAAAYLELSPLLTAMVVGAMLINTSTSREAIVRVIAQGQRPFYFVLLIFAGASWIPAAASWLPVVLFIGARAAAKIGGSRLSARLAHAIPSVGVRWGWALIGQGGLALAIALEYLRHHAAIFPNVVFSCAVISVLLTDLLSARVAQRVISPLIEYETPPEPFSATASEQEAMP